MWISTFDDPGDRTLPAAVVAHGAGSSARFVRAAFEEPLAAAGHRLVTYGLRGSVAGEPAREVADHHPAAHAHDLAAVVAAVGARVVGGVSLGAHAAALVAGEERRELDGVLLCLPAGVGRLPEGAGAHALVAAQIREHGLIATLERAVADPAVPPWLADLLDRDWRSWDEPSLVAALESLDGGWAPGSDDLSAIAAPTAVVGWPDDPFHPLDAAQRWAAIIPRAALEETTLSALGDDVTALGQAAVRAWQRATSQPHTAGSRPTRRVIEVVAHDPGWADLAERERERIVAVASDELVAVEHIGSTAVPGLDAKPVIDLLVGLRSWPAPPFVEAMEGLGYHHHGEAGIVGRHYLTDASRSAPRTFHVHAVAHGSRFWTDHLLLRDHLRAHPTDAAAYAAVKRAAARRHRYDSLAYLEDKHDLVRALLRRARAAAGEEDVHAAAAAGFGAAAEVYERSRPGYPAPAVAHLTTTLDLGPGVRVIDVGAGTGKLTAALLPSGAAVVAAEPVAGMRALLADRLPDVEVVDGTAEDLPLPSASAHAIAVGQAFHWFEPSAALSEFHRVLEIGGRVGLVWNVRDESVGWVRRWTDIVDRVSAGSPRERLRAWVPVLEATGLFTGAEVRSFPNPHPVPPETLVERVASISFVAALDADRRGALLDDFRHLLATHPYTRDRERIAVPYRTEVHTFRRVP